MEQLYNLLITQEDRRELLATLETLSENLFKTGLSAKEALEKTRFGKGILGFLPENWETDRNALEAQITGTIAQVKAIKTVHIILPIKPSEKIVSLILAWGKSNFPEKVIFDITVKPEIIGGAIFEIDGKYLDHSLATKLEAAFDKKHSEITRLINADEEADSHRSVDISS